MRSFVKIPQNRKAAFMFVCISVCFLVILVVQQKKTWRITDISTHMQAGVVWNLNSAARPEPDNRISFKSETLVNAPIVYTHLKQNRLNHSITSLGLLLAREWDKISLKKQSKNSNQECFTSDAEWSGTLSGKLGRTPANMESWKFNQTVECPNFNINEIENDQPRLKLSLKCRSENQVFDYLIWTHNKSDVHTAPFGDICVDKFIQNCCRGPHKIPNVVHYVWYKQGELTFVGFTSLLGVIRFVNPCAIIFHGEKIPHGKYWDAIVNIWPNIIHLKRDHPEFISGKRFGFSEHSGDIMRIQALIRYGGIYLDMDTIIVKPLESLRNQSCVMSIQSSGLFVNAFIMAEKNAPFLHLWKQGYKHHYNNSDYIYNSMIYPGNLARAHGDLIHVEYATISRPYNMTGHKIYQSDYVTYDWSHIYGIHLFTRIYNGRLNEFTIRHMRSTAGSIFRHVIFGNKELCTRHPAD